jgi:hypothetical protein
MMSDDDTVLLAMAGDVRVTTAASAQQWGVVCDAATCAGCRSLSLDV